MYEVVEVVVGIVNGGATEPVAGGVYVVGGMYVYVFDVAALLVLPDDGVQYEGAAELAPAAAKHSHS